VIVIDVGCARIGADYSVERLIEMFRPDVLIGFDPYPRVSEAMPALKPGSGNLVVELRREAAWTYDGLVGYRADGPLSMRRRWP